MIELFPVNEELLAGNNIEDQLRLRAREFFVCNGARGRSSRFLGRLMFTGGPDTRTSANTVNLVDRLNIALYTTALSIFMDIL